jgi:phosphoglucosamine mutase
VTLKERRPLDQMKALQKASQKVESALGRSGRLLVRWSGTEPKLRIMVEGEDLDAIRAYASEIAQAARADVPAQ